MTRITTAAAAATTTLTLLFSLWAPPAAAQSWVRYTNAGQLGPVVSEMHQTNTKLVYEFYNNANTTIGTATCPAPSSCQPRFPVGTAKFSVVLEYDAAREEQMSEICKGVASTVPQGRCIDGELRVTMRARWGTVKYSFIPDSRPGQNRSAPSFGGWGPTAKLEFDADATKFVLPVANGLSQPGGGMAVAVGSYKMRAGVMTGFCKPRHTNPNELLQVREGQVTEYTLRYTGTLCTMSIKSWNASPAGAGTFTSLPARLNCGSTANPDICRAEFPFDSTVRLIANPAPGYTATFGRNFTGCSRNEPDQAICEILADGDRELSSSFFAVTTTPPPPPPVALTAAAGPASPANATVPKGSAAVAMLQAVMTPANGTARLRAITLQASGSGRDDLDLSDIRVINDLNRNGAVDPGEPLLARGQATADNGSLRLALAAPLEFSEPVVLLVVADVANTLHTAAAALGGGLMLALGALGIVRRRRREVEDSAARRWLLSAAWLVVAAVMATGLAACGGGDPEPEVVAAPNPAPVSDPSPPTSPPPSPTPSAPAPPAPAPPPAPPPLPAPVFLTYKLQLTAVEATNTAATPVVINVAGSLPLAGAEISVQK